jgi:hypothetical protein
MKHLKKLITVKFGPFRSIAFQDNKSQSFYNLVKFILLSSLV